MGDLQCTETPLHDTMFVEQVISYICEARQNCERENVKNYCKQWTIVKNNILILVDQL